MKSFLSPVISRIASVSRTAWSWAMAHKIIAGFAVLIILFAGYKAYAAHEASVTTTQYALARVSAQPIQSTVTASGDVAASHQLDLAPKTSGEVTGVYVKTGDTVSVGQLVATIDDTNAEQSLQDAELALQSAQVSYAQAISSANASISNSQTGVTTSSQSAFDAITAAESSFATVTHGIDLLLHANSDAVGYQNNETMDAYVNMLRAQAPQSEALQQAAQASWLAAVDSYNQTFADFQSASRSSSPQDIKNLLSEEQGTAAKVAQAAKDAQAFFVFVQRTSQNAILPTQLPSINTQVSTVEGYVSTMTSVSSSLDSAQTSLANAVQTYSSNTQTIDGGAPLPIQSAELTLEKAKQSVAEAQTALADYVVRAPFAGTIAEVYVQKYDQSGTKVATLITNEQYADIQLNESDVASVRVGQPATLTFDAINGLTINGTVAEVDQVGTVTQGVTNYTVKIGFDTQDSRVKPGMTVNATIVTASKDSALVIPTSALKGTDGNYYVQVATLTAGAPQMQGIASTSRRMRTGSSTASLVGAAGSSTRAFRIGSSTAAFAGRMGGNLTVSTSDVTIRLVPVTIGIQSDTMTEITSGLNPGELVVSQSLNASGAATIQSKGLFGLFGGGSRTAGTPTRSGGNAGFGGGGGGATFRAGGGGGFGG